jgi:hypothetical protein
MDRFWQFVDRLGAWAVSLGKMAAAVTALFYDTVTVFFMGGKKALRPR